MAKTTRLLMALAITFTLLGADHAAASDSTATAADIAAAAERPATSAPEDARVLARTPWTHIDPVGDVMNPSGNLRRVVIENGRQLMKFTFNLAGTPVWDNNSNDLATGMVFAIDWRNTTPSANRVLVVQKYNNIWQAVIFNGNGAPVCSRTGGVSVLPNYGFRIGAPVVQCLGGAHVLRVGGAFVEDQDPTDVEEFIEDVFPNPTAYGPFIALPSRSRSRSAEAGTANGWTIH